MVLAMIAIFGNLLRLAAQEKAQLQNARNVTLPETVFCLFMDTPEGETRIIADRRGGQDYALLFETEADAAAFLEEAKERKGITSARVGGSPVKGLRFAFARYKPADKPPVDMLL